MEKSPADWHTQLLSDPFDFVNVARSFRMRDERFRHTRFDYFAVKERLHDLIKQTDVPEQQIPGSHPLALCVTEIDKVPFHVFFGVRYYDSSQLTINVQSYEFKSPKCNALILISPMIGTGDRSVDPTADNVINRAKTLLYCLLGKENITDYIGTLFMDSQTGQVAQFSPGYKSLTIFDAFEIGDNRELDEINQRLNLQTKEVKERLRLATGLFSRAIFDDDDQVRFMQYWIALEVLSNTQNQGVIDRLANAYGVSKADIKAATHVERVYKMRLELFHGGKFEKLESRFERSIAAIFIDLLRAQIGLQCVRHAEKYFKWQRTIPDDKGAA